MATKTPSKKKVTPAQQAANERAMLKSAERALGGPVSDARRTKLINKYRKGGFEGAFKEINIYRKTAGLPGLTTTGKIKNAADIRNTIPLPEQVAYEVGKKQELPAFDETGQKTAIEGELTPFYNTETEEQGRGYVQARENLSSAKTRNEQMATNNQIGIDETVGQEKRGFNSDIVTRGAGSSSPAYQKLQERLTRLQKQRQTETDQTNTYNRETDARAINQNEQQFTDFQTRRRREFGEKVATELEARRNAALGVNQPTTTTY